VIQTRVQCPACKASFEVPAALAGRDGECSQCRKVFRLKPLSGEVDSSVLSNGDSSATLEMPIVAEGRASADTDEFEIPDSSATSLEATDSELRTPNTPELEISELNQPELDVPAPSVSKKKKKSEPAAEVPLLDVSTDELPPVLIEDGGSLLGDELPGLEEVRKPVSRYDSEDAVDPDEGGSYPLAESLPSPKNRKAKKVRRKKAAPGKTVSKRRDGRASVEGDSQAASDHDLDADEVQLFDDVLHDDDDGAGPSFLRRSGAFSTIGKSPSGKSPGKNRGRAKAIAGSNPEKRAKRQAQTQSEGTGSDSGRQSSKPVPKRRDSEGRPSSSRSESDIGVAPRPRRQSLPFSPESHKKLIMIVGGAVGLLLLFTAFSYLTSGPPVVMPTAQSGAGRSSSTQPSGSAPVPNQGDDSIQTGDTMSSVERANRIRTAPGLPRHPDDAADGAKGVTVDTQLSGNRTIVASSVDAQEIVTGSVSAGIFQTDDDKLFAIDTVEIPTFPEPGRPRASTVSGVVFYEIAIVGLDQEKTRDDDSLPGSRMDMILYLPSGTHERGSLPCVMIAAAGTTLLEGNGCYDESYQLETIPYVKQGFAVLGYSLDGPIASDDPSKMESKAAYDRFRAAHAGLVNSRNAMEFLLQKIPAINHERIFTAGHSSAGTLSLLFAEHESRLAGCIAYAPCLDVEKRLSEYIANPLVKILMPEVDQFVRQGSPQRHLLSLKCPVFLFHAEGDTNASFAESREFAERLNAQGTPCKLESVPDGDHYSSMLEDGIPRGISWLKNTAMQTSSVSSSPPGPGPQ
jgi:alpha-beta hydrolase superfamily lysophospholipase